MTIAITTRVATVLTVYGIETLQLLPYHKISYVFVATVLTVYGIETSSIFPLSVALLMRCNSAYRLRY